MVWPFICIVLLIWYIVIVIIAYIGFFEILGNYRSKKYLSLETFEPVTILRPIKGIDPELESCLESSFLQDYPHDKLEIIFCIDDKSDSSIPIINALIAKYPNIDAKIYYSKHENGRVLDHYGPNPKVNNLSKGFLAAKNDILWIMDSNVWASSNILKNSIKSLNENLVNGGIKNVSKYSNLRKVKLVHQVPLAMAINKDKSIFSKLGSKLDEMFLFSSHSKFYVSLNKLNPAPCVNGKSNIFRRSDLDNAVAKIPYADNVFFKDLVIKQSAREISQQGPGNSLKFFAKYIGEDNMIAIALWEFLFCRTTLTTDLVIQPLNKLEKSSHGVSEYFKRRIRWLRVRKYMVFMATLIEPTTESIVCGTFGSLSLSYFLWDKWFSMKFFIFHMIIWCITDYIQYIILINNIQSGDKPFWFHFHDETSDKLVWLFVWILREVFALPIWIMAMMGQTIDWRGKPFIIKRDLTAEEL
ncbi:ceramide glucosyltransferase [[Candida] jaroonii]|uniref:Ceramide glucosyltransferase n=1 Tax=[Candida] jaroonii TaxID=467808 RepID=A0ACA9Y873_9ASCO|nr:ceramide glucosyltransferase [[Candida] jaroonii]